MQALPSVALAASVWVLPQVSASDHHDHGMPGRVLYTLHAGLVFSTCMVCWCLRLSRGCQFEWGQPRWVEVVSAEEAAVTMLLDVFQVTGPAMCGASREGV